MAEVTDAGFAALEDAGGAPAYTYSFTFADRDLSTADRTDAEQDMVEALTEADARVDDLIDADSNQGIGYARDDVDGDSMMWMTLCAPSGSNSEELASGNPATLRANSTTAICIPRQMPNIGTLFRRA